MTLDVYSTNKYFSNADFMGEPQMPDPPFTDSEIVNASRLFDGKIGDTYPENRVPPGVARITFILAGRSRILENNPDPANRVNLFDGLEDRIQPYIRLSITGDADSAEDPGSDLFQEQVKELIADWAEEGQPNPLSDNAIDAAYAKADTAQDRADWRNRIEAAPIVHGQSALADLEFTSEERSILELRGYDSVAGIGSAQTNTFDRNGTTYTVTQVRQSTATGHALQIALTPTTNAAVDFSDVDWYVGSTYFPRGNADRAAINAGQYELEWRLEPLVLPPSGTYRVAPYAEQAGGGGGGLTAGQVDNRIRTLRPNEFTTADEQKLDGIEANAKDDQTGAEMRDALNELNTSDQTGRVFQQRSDADIDGRIATWARANSPSGTVPDNRIPNTIARDSEVPTDSEIDTRANNRIAATVQQYARDGTSNIPAGQLGNQRFTADDETKLDGIESNAKDDQTGTEIRDALNGLDSADQTGRVFQTGGGGGLTSVTSDATLTGDGTGGSPLGVANEFTDDDETKLDGIETGATADQTGVEIRTLLNGLSSGQQTGRVFRQRTDTEIDNRIATWARVNIPPGTQTGAEFIRDTIGATIIPETSSFISVEADDDANQIIVGVRETEFNTDVDARIAAAAPSPRQISIPFSLASRTVAAGNRVDTLTLGSITADHGTTFGSVASNELTLADAGVYNFYFVAAFTTDVTSGGFRPIPEYIVERQPSGSSTWTEVLMQGVYGKNVPQGRSPFRGSGERRIIVAANDKFRVRMDLYRAADVQTGNESTAGTLSVLREF